MISCNISKCDKTMQHQNDDSTDGLQNKITW